MSTVVNYDTEFTNEQGGLLASLLTPPHGRWTGSSAHRLTTGCPWEVVILSNRWPGAHDGSVLRSRAHDWGAVQTLATGAGAQAMARRRATQSRSSGRARHESSGGSAYASTPHGAT